MVEIFENSNLVGPIHNNLGPGAGLDNTTTYGSYTVANTDRCLSAIPDGYTRLSMYTGRR